MALNFFGKGLTFEFGLNNSRKIRDWQPGVLHECVRGTNRIIKNHLAFIPFTHPFLFSSSAYLPKLTFKKENFCDFISSVYNLFNAIKTDKVLISRREWYAITGGYPQPLYNNWETYRDFRPKFDGGSVTCRKWTNLYFKKQQIDLGWIKWSDLIRDSLVPSPRLISTDSHTEKDNVV